MNRAINFGLIIESGIWVRITFLNKERTDESMVPRILLFMD
jgi:hypothetical protein